jgi:outer membrane murein-binding lipoprotein Lpp
MSYILSNETNNNNINDILINLIDKSFTKIDILSNKIDQLSNKVDILTNKVDNLKKEFDNNIDIKTESKLKTKKIIKKIDNEYNFYKEIIREQYDIDNYYIIECLDMNSMEGELKIFKKIYIENVSKEYYPIRSIRKKLQYWKDGIMNDDITNTYIKSTIIENIKDIYLNVNKFENYKDNIDQFFRNQNHISKLNEQKYQDKFLNEIIQIIKI